MSDQKHVVDMLLKENLRLATEVDLLMADLRYLRDIMQVMSRLLQQHEVPVPTDELANLSRQHDERLKNVQQMSDVISQFQQNLAGMRTGEDSAGMRTGRKTYKPVTDEDVENILKQIDEI